MAAARRAYGRVATKRQRRRQTRGGAQVVFIQQEEHKGEITQISSEAAENKASRLRPSGYQ
jgi:hypothetical protein